MCLNRKKKNTKGRMILITKASTNNVVLTLTEKVTINNPVFLFEFICDQTRDRFFFIADDVSEFTDRYNEFSIIEKLNPVALNGEISLVRAGFYSYKIREQESLTNLDPALSGSVVEVGKVKVLSISPAVHKHLVSNSITVYNA